MIQSFQSYTFIVRQTILTWGQYEWYFCCHLVGKALPLYWQDSVSEVTTAVSLHETEDESDYYSSIKVSPGIICFISIFWVNGLKRRNSPLFSEYISILAILSSE